MRDVEDFSETFCLKSIESSQFGFVLAQVLAQVLGSISIVSTDSGDMPLSQLQIDALKTPTTVIEIQTDNPKKPGSKAAERFDRYKMATNHSGSHQSRSKLAGPIRRF